MVSRTFICFNLTIFFTAGSLPSGRVGEDVGLVHPHGLDHGEHGQGIDVASAWNNTVNTAAGDEEELQLAPHLFAICMHTE